MGLAAYATIMLRGPQGLSALNDRRRQIQALEVENANLSRDIENKKKRLDLLKHDPKTQEVEIEKRLGRVHQGATEFKITGGPTPDLSATASDASALKSATKK